MTSEMIQVERLAKSFGNHDAVNGISFDVLAGETLGLLGPNGAGKTTTIRMLTGLVRPSSGRITVDGYDVLKNPIEVKRLFDISPQEASLHPHLGIAEDLYFYARLRGLSRKDAKLRAQQTLQWAKLESHAKKNGHQLSGGMQRRLLMARALITDPPILYLDEPTTGLDPQSRHALWEYIFELKRRGKTMILTTHYMEEAEKLCDRVIIIDHGKIIAEGSPAKLRRGLGIDSILTLKPRRPFSSADLRALKEIPGVLDLSSPNGSNGCITVHLREKEALDEIVVAASRLAGIDELNLTEASLEDVFLQLTGRGLRE
ncbi:MAG: ABC transporter ATP-binding protein [Methanothrix sp.]|mgnify:CR=1 FL=1|jgi:ABC-type multidrug transport system ATPase subunit|nr:ABC transporter ATP-binding protein [Methanothrix sp.]NLX39495.1 ABC transporter ATP-binding protein [Methanothrix sp.]HNR58513.1 ABC transporter ATP-binding protein [Methanothrix sp.]HOI68547.1 ABC transporter ATP-binding protein [Methanothrix sp.]HPY72223.1 ABC transporter ATP-binding protein [Methanothrix sp.]